MGQLADSVEVSHPLDGLQMKKCFLGSFIVNEHLQKILSFLLTLDTLYSNIMHYWSGPNPSTLTMATITASHSKYSYSDVGATHASQASSY